MRAEIILVITLILMKIERASLSKSITLLRSGYAFAAYTNWSPTQSNSVQFRFKTHLRHCILLYADNTVFSKLDSSYLLLTLEKGQLIATVYIANSSEILLRTAKFSDNVNDINWHSVEISVSKAGIHIQLDKKRKLLTLNIFRLSSPLYFGGVKRGQSTSSVFKMGLRSRFQGCIDSIKMIGAAGKVQDVELLDSTDTRPGCLNACQRNPCNNGGKCLNMFTRYRCDCIGTGYGGNNCTRVADSVSLQRENFITVNITKTFHDLVLVLRLRTRLSNGLLVTVHDDHRRLSMAIVDGFLKIAVGKNAFTLGDGMLHDTQWHRVTVSLSNGIITATLDAGVSKSIEISEPNRGFKFPLYIGGQPKHLFSGSSLTSDSFMGCLQQVYVNELNILLRAFRMIDREKIFATDGQAPSCKMKTEDPQKVRKEILAAKEREKRRKKLSVKVPKEMPSKDKDETQEKYPGYSKVLASNNKDMITWITSGVVSGVVVLMIITACAIHYFKFKYESIFLSRVQQQESTQRQENGNVMQMYPKHQAVIYLPDEQRAKVVSL